MGWAIWKTKNKRLAKYAVKYIKRYRYTYKYRYIARTAPLSEVREEAYRTLIENCGSEDDRIALGIGALNDPDPKLRLLCQQYCFDENVHKLGLFDPDIEIRKWAIKGYVGFLPENYDPENPKYVLKNGKIEDNPNYVSKPTAPKKQKELDKSIEKLKRANKASVNQAAQKKTQGNAATDTAKKKQDTPEPKWDVRLMTRSDLSPENKNYLFIHSFADNDEKDSFAKKLLDFPYGRQLAVFTAEPASQVFEKFRGSELDMMNIYIPIIGADFLEAAKRLSFDKKMFFPDLQKKGIYVLPIIKNKKILFEFMEQFGEVHAVFLSDKNAMDSIEKEIERFVRTEDWAQRALEKAFTKQVFFSYRKKDRTGLINAMKELHNVPSGSDMAIWFDDFLIPGDNYHRELEAKMQESNAFALLVTPNLLEEGNYVIEKEYPFALEHKKERIIPIEAQKTERTELDKCCPELPDTVWYKDSKGIENRLDEMFGKGNQKKTTSEKNYLLGMCFLLGILVEKDVDRALSLLTAAADEKHIDACEQLFMMYNMGYAVKKDPKEAFKWRERQYELIRESDVDQLDALEQLYDILFYSYDGLIVYLGSRMEREKADEITRDFCRRIDALSQESLSDQLKLRRIEARLMYIDILRTPDTSTGYNSKASDALKELERLLPELKLINVSDTKEKRRLLAICFGLMGEFNAQKGNIEKAEKELIECCDRLSSMLKKDSQNYDLKKLYRTSLSNLGSLQYQCSCNVLRSAKASVYEDSQQSQNHAEILRMGDYDSFFRQVSQQLDTARQAVQPTVKEYLHKAFDTLTNAYKLAKQMVDEDPTTNNLEALVMVIFLYTQTFDDSIAYKAVAYWKEGSQTIDKLVALGNPASDYARIKNIFDRAASFL